MAWQSERDVRNLNFFFVVFCWVFALLLRKILHVYYYYYIPGKCNIHEFNFLDSILSSKAIPKIKPASEYVAYASL